MVVGIQCTPHATAEPSGGTNAFLLNELLPGNRLRFISETRIFGNYTTATVSIYGLRWYLGWVEFVGWAVVVPHKRLLPVWHSATVRGPLFRSSWDRS